MPVETCSYSLQ